MKLIMPEKHDTSEELEGILNALEDLTTQGKLSHDGFNKGVVMLAWRHVVRGASENAVILLRRLPQEYPLGMMFEQMEQDPDFHNLVVALAKELVLAKRVREGLGDIRPTQGLAKAGG